MRQNAGWVIGGLRQTIRFTDSAALLFHLISKLYRVPGSPEVCTVL